MRVTISFDSATTEQTREIALALHHVGLTGQLKVGINGPHCWTGSTPPLTVTQWAGVAAELVKVDDVSIADLVKSLREVS